MDTPRDKTATVGIMLRVREDLRQTLEQAAKARRVSLNQEIVDRLDYVRDRLGLLHEIFELAYGERVAGILMMLGRVMRVAGGKGKEGDWTPEDFDDAAKAGSVLLQALRSGATVPTSAADVSEMLALNMLRGLVDPNYPDRFPQSAELDEIRRLLAPIVARWGGAPAQARASSSNPLHSSDPPPRTQNADAPPETPRSRKVAASTHAAIEAHPRIKAHRDGLREMTKIAKSNLPSLAEGKGTAGREDAPRPTRGRRRDN